MNFSIAPENPMILIYILIVIIIATLITRIIAYIMNKMDRFHKNKAAIYLARDIINYIIYFIALMIILQFFGINLAGTLLSLGIVGIAVSFAAKDIISNMFSGMILILGKSIKVGDTIEINGKRSSATKRILAAEESVRLRRRALQQSYYLAALPHLEKAPAWGALAGVRPTKLSTKHLLEGGSVKSAHKMLKDVYFVEKDRRKLAVDGSFFIK